MSDNTFVGVQFKPIGKTYTFLLPEAIDVERGNLVVVNTVRGKQIGKVTSVNLGQPENTAEVQSIERIANDADLQRKAEITAKEEEVVAAVAKYLRDPGHDGVKVVDAEYSLDRSRLTIYLNYETGIDFNPRNFIRDISNIYRDCRIEVRQVGPRDAAKALSGIGSCGIEMRCCSRFLTDFSSISIKMAKSQDISLTPMEITGICGRLRCCLAYEHEMYEEARAKLPKKKKLIMTPLGEGKVRQVLPLKDAVLVDLPEKGPQEFTRTELETGVMQEKVAPITISESSYISHDEDVEVITLESPKPREDRSNNRRNKSSDRSQQSGRSQQETPRDGQQTARNRRSSNNQRSGQDSAGSQQPRQQGETKQTGNTGQEQGQRKSGSGRRRKSRPHRDQSTDRTAKEE